VAIGRPGEQLPELGFAKIYAAGDQWRDTVLALLAKSQLVVLNVPSFTEGFQWELEQTLASIPLSRVVLMFPWPSAEADREPIYAKLREIMAERSSVEMPERLSRAFFITFEQDSSVILIGGREHPGAHTIQRYVENLLWRLVEAVSRAHVGEKASGDVVESAIAREPDLRRWRSTVFGAACRGLPSASGLP
jgi:hypothetical protein